MAYNINKSNSDPVTIPTGAIDNQFDIPLIGQDAINYGDDLALAFVRLLENFANSTQPSFGSGRTTGQLWYDTNGSGTLNVYDGTGFVAIPKTSEVVQNTGDENISGDKTFNGIPAFNGGTSGSEAPFTVDSTFLVTDLNADLLDGQEGSYYAVKTETYGKLTKYIPANEMHSVTTNGAAGNGDTSGAGAVPALQELTAGQPELYVWDFDTTTSEAVQFNFAFPKEWDEGTVTFQVFWAAASASNNSVVWTLEGVAMGATEAIDVSYGASAVDTNSSANGGLNILNVTTESAAMTIAGTPNVDNMTFFRLSRNVGAAGDDLAADARLLGIKLFYTTDAATTGAAV
jgi:hypothetical protein